MRLIALLLLLSGVVGAADEQGRLRGLPIRLGAAVTVDEPDPDPETGHPRLLMTVDGASPTVSELQARLGTGGAQETQFQAFLNIYCKTTANGGVFDTDPEDDHKAIWIYGFLYATYPVTGADYHDCTDQDGILTRFLASFDAIVSDTPCGCTRDATTIGIAYDWVYAGLTGTRSGASKNRRGEAIDFIQANAPDPGSVNLWGHADTGGRGRLLYHWAGYVWAGDGIEDADATTRIGTRSTYYTGTAGTLTALNLTAGDDDGSYPEGLGYWMSEWQQGMGWLHFLYADSYRTSQGVDTFAAGEHTAFEYFPSYLAWLLSPYKPNDSSGCGECLRILKTPSSDDRGSDATFPDTTQQYMSLLPNIARAYATSNPSMAALAKWLYTTLFYTSGTIPQSVSNTTHRWALLANYLGYNTVSASSPSALDLPLAKHFDQGYVIIRDNWLFDGTSSWVRFTAEPYAWGAPLGYSQVCQGGFEIHRRGPLVIAPGAGAHSAIQETGWGCNTIIFPKPAETRGSIVYWDKGGARPPYAFDAVSDTASLVPDSQWDIGGLKTGTGRVDLTDGTHSTPSTTHSYSYVYADLTRAYNSTSNHDDENSEKISNYERQLVRFPPTTPGTSPGYTVIFDRTTTTSTDVEPRWQLYPAAHTTAATKTMSISGASSTDTVTRNSIETTRYVGTCPSMTGTISYSGVWGMAAKAYWSPLIPSSCYIIERGGPNGSGQFGQTDSHEHEDPYGVQGGCFEDDEPGGTGCGFLSSSGMRPFEGAYKYELLYQTTAQTEPFLNVIEDVETSASAKTALAVLSGTHTTGVRIDAASPRCAVFKTTTGSLTTGSFDLEADGTYDCLIADLPASTAITFTKGSNITSVTHIGTSDTDLTYTTTAQGTIWLRIVVGSDGTGATNRVSW